MYLNNVYKPTLISSLRSLRRGQRIYVGLLPIHLFRCYRPNVCWRGKWCHDAACVCVCVYFVAYVGLVRLV